MEVCDLNFHFIDTKRKFAACVSKWNGLNLAAQRIQDDSRMPSGFKLESHRPGARESGASFSAEFRTSRVGRSGWRRPARQVVHGRGPVAPIQIIGGPSWIDDDRYDIQATAHCSGGALCNVPKTRMLAKVESPCDQEFGEQFR